MTHTPRYTLYIDKRGRGLNVFKRIYNEDKRNPGWIQKHSKLAKQFEIKQVNNLKYDLIVYDTWMGVFSHAFEAKMNADLVSSLNSGMLRRELEETYRPLRADNEADMGKDAEGEDNIVWCPDTIQLYVIAGGQYDPVILTRVIGMMNSYKDIDWYVASTAEKGINKIFKMITDDKSEQSEYIPTLVKVGNKSFALSMAGLLNGVSVPLAHHLTFNWYKGVTEAEISEWINDFYGDGKNYGELASKLYNVAQKTWLKEEDE